MRRPIARAAIAALLATALFITLPARAQEVCAPLTRETLRQGIESAVVIVVARVAEGPSDDSVVVVPERYYKGTAEARSFLLQGALVAPGCAPGPLDPGNHVLLVLERHDNQLSWPDASRVFLLHDGVAGNAADETWSPTESALEEDIQSLTGQESVPVEAGDSGEQIDWLGTVLPVAAALVVVFGIGLVLMRVWHRIDPT